MFYVFIRSAVLGLKPTKQKTRTQVLRIWTFWKSRPEATGQTKSHRQPQLFFTVEAVAHGVTPSLSDAVTVFKQVGYKGLIIPMPGHSRIVKSRSISSTTSHNISSFHIISSYRSCSFCIHFDSKIFQFLCQTAKKCGRQARHALVITGFFVLHQKGAEALLRVGERDQLVASWRR